MGEIDLLSLINEMKKTTEIVYDEIDEENKRLQDNYCLFNTKYNENLYNKPFRDVGKYAVGDDYEEIADLSYKKMMNEDFEVKADVWKRYFNSNNPYIGRMDLLVGNDEVIYYITDKSGLSTPTDNQADIKFIHADDYNYIEYVRMWRGYLKNDNVFLIRNIDIKDRKVIDSKTIFEKGNDELNSIQDEYLKNVLIKNKTKKGIHSIVRTIQQKQDEIIYQPIDKSFIVQGCAGSGKTMVLLHRLKYLIYNNFTNDANKAKTNYIVLTPSDRFINYIKDISYEFNIKTDSILSHKDYFAYIARCKRIGDETEINLPESFLKTAYSKDFIRNCYWSLFEYVGSIVEKLVSELNKKIILLNDESLLTDKIKIAKNLIISRKEEFYNSYNELMNVLNIDGIQTLKEDLSVVEKNMSFLEKRIKSGRSMFEQTKDKLDKFLNQPKKEITKTIEDTKRMIELEEEIKNFSLLIKNANSITKSFYEEKLNELQNEYYSINNKYDEISKSNEKIENELQDELQKYSYFANTDLTYVDVENIIQKIRKKYKIYIQDNNSYKDSIKRLENQIITNKEKAKELKHRIEILLDKKRFNELGNCVMNIETLSNTVRNFLLDINNDIISNNYSNFESFTLTNKESFWNDLVRNTLLKKAIEFYEINKINNYKNYKFYYFNLAYFNYLVRGVTTNTYNLVCIDEAQDLTSVELELISKYNNNPCMNIFGDVNQAISSNCISNWEEQVPWINKIYELNENFRNTNQIIDYCNCFLNFKMERVGIDLDRVDEISNIDEVDIINVDCIITRDEDEKNEIKSYLLKKGINNINIFTTFEVKGLEYNRVIVYKKNMNINELYIACTRALSKLIILYKI